MIVTNREELRLKALRHYQILDSEPDGTFDRITSLTAEILGVPCACVTLVDERRTWFMSKCGFDVHEVQRFPGLCDSTIQSNEILHHENALEDPIAKNNPLVNAEGGIRFYAGAPLLTPDGLAIGALCSFGPEPRGLSEQEKNWMRELAAFVMHEIESRRMRLELNATANALHQAQRLGSIGLVASGVAHDFNNLLLGIIGNTSLLKEELEPEGTAFEILKEVEAIAERAGELVGQVLAYAGREDVEAIVAVDLNRLVRQTHYMLQSMIHENTRLQLNLASEPAIVKVNPSAMRQLIMNLITNASEAYEGEMGVVSLSTAVRGGFVCLSIRDCGKGVDADTKERMFEPLFTTKSEGRGLGLSVVQRAVAAFGGTVRVDSKVGTGTTIEVRMPASNSSPVDEKVRIPERDDCLGEGTVLVVDDQEIILNLAERILERSHYKVLRANDGNEASSLLEKHKDVIVAVLLDMSMPVLSGAETLRELKRIAPDVKVILSSGHTEEQVLEKFEDGSIQGFLKKPYRPADLLEQLAIVAGV